jgi:L-arabinose transport system permease protein
MAEAPLSAGKARGARILSVLRNSGMVAVFAALFLVLSIFVPFFFTAANLVGLLLSVSMVGMGASTMLFCLASGEIDISVESIVALSGVMSAVLVNLTGSVSMGVLGGAIIGAAIGLANGVVVAKFKINSLIATLAMMQIVRGLGFIVSKGSAIGVSEPGFFAIGNSFFLKVPMPVWITAACFIVFGVVFKKTAFGRETRAVGGDAESARLAGIDVARVKIAIFTLQGLVVGVAGVVLASRMTSGQPNTSTGYSLDVVSACVLGGVSLSGGVGTVSGTIAGILVMGTVQNAMGLLNMPTFYQYVTRGLILLSAVLFDRFRTGRRR